MEEWKYIIQLKDGLLQGTIGEDAVAEARYKQMT
jgi:hypothetical protein